MNPVHPAAHGFYAGGNDPKSLDDYVEAFERDQQIGSARAMREYLPERDDALYLTVLRELVRIDLELGWESNRPRSLDDYRHDFPELFEDLTSVQEVAFEEFRLRRRAGQSPKPEEYSKRYGVRTDDWPGEPCEDPLHVSLQLERIGHSYRAHRHLEETNIVPAGEWRLPSELQGEVAQLFQDLQVEDGVRADHLADGLSALPCPGSDFLGFHLVSEMGRGAFGRVFLARQAALADRPVALKVAPDVGQESQTLAQLQHTHIVPIYSVHKAGPLQAVCMPYSGSVTLGEVLRHLRGQPELPRHGADLLAALPLKDRPPGVPTPQGASEAVQKALTGLDYPCAVLWLGARLAEGLTHAHERGVLHRDIKPANVLLTDEGMPMLLDFNVAEDVKRSDAAVAMLGGTIPYMAPEHLSSFRDGQLRVDARSDIYSLGIVLFELMTGRYPFPPARFSQGDAGGISAVLEKMLRDRTREAPNPRNHNPAISPAAASIVRHCLEPNPVRRYGSAKSLREDIERHLAHEPLRHAPEPSPRERLGKFVRRHPRTPLLVSILCVALLAVVAGVLGVRGVQMQRTEQANRSLAAFAKDFRQAQFLLQVPAASVAERLQGEDAARRALALYALPGNADWQKLPALTALPQQRRVRLRGEVGELLLLLARCIADRGPAVEERREALECNVLAECCFELDDAPAMLWEQRADLLATLDPSAAKAVSERAAATPIRSTRDHYLKARELLLQRRYIEASRLLRPAVERSPDCYQALFLLGICNEGLAKETEACRCYTACIALEPDFYGPFAARGTVYARLKEYDAARADFDRVVELAPDRAETYFDRAAVLQFLVDERKTTRRREAIADLDTALAKGLAQTRIYFFRSRLRQALGDRDGARADFDAGMQLPPQDERSWVARGLARIKDNPRAAIEDFDAALRIDPTCQSALMNKAHVLAEQLDRQDEARSVLAQLLSLYPDHVGALAGQAVVLARLQRRQEALNHIARALQLDRGGLTQYQAGCVFALTSRESPADAESALFYLRRAIDQRFGLDILARDADLKSLHGNAGFAKLTRLAASLREKVPVPRRLLDKE